MSNDVSFHIGTFADGDQPPYPGIVVAGRVYDTRTVLPHTSTAAMLRDWEPVLRSLQDFANTVTGDGRPVEELRVLAPVQQPGQIFAAGANYREHIIQITVAHRIGTPARPRQNCVSRQPGRPTSGPPMATLMSGSACRQPSVVPMTT